MAGAKPFLETSLRSKLTRYILQQQMVELVYRDASGQVQVVHSRIRDLFTRPGGDFLALDKGVLLAVDHILIIDGQNLNAY
ncbi:hypothetical protein SAMN05216203_1182 [Marinobacter daqiaonensis]|uniref:Rho-binding antiterminator n=1 Tax=Marinobacter daqiaonensis TaxID=650891 RepID=A0A1I6HFA2_9GAMM|nr:hypothetical protein [Marinobacter daqiaonensis]SFR53054.1 hypothetical protein SAMN05216203_1182 [Marinobacter daqiaonensis]